MPTADFDTLVPGSGLSRRAFARTAAGAGFAAAVLPVVAQTTIKTDTRGYLVGCAEMFRSGAGYTHLFQIVFSKGNVTRQSYPMSRAHLYAG